jgi:hypothetical protein
MTFGCSPSEVDALRNIARVCWRRLLACRPMPRSPCPYVVPWSPVILASIPAFSRSAAMSSLACKKGEKLNKKAATNENCHNPVDQQLNRTKDKRQGSTRQDQTGPKKNHARLLEGKRKRRQQIACTVLPTKPAKPEGPILCSRMSPEHSQKTSCPFQRCCY